MNLAMTEDRVRGWGAGPGYDGGPCACGGGVSNLAMTEDQPSPVQTCRKQVTAESATRLPVRVSDPVARPSQRPGCSSDSATRLPIRVSDPLIRPLCRCAASK